MPPEVIAFITHYGYLAIFFLVFSQEVGIPSPVPNELVLVFSGYLVFKGILFMPLVVLVAISADFAATNLLYFTFYFFGAYIIRNKPRWLPISTKKIDTLSKRISDRGRWAIYLGRLTPFIRGYTSVITGLVRIRPIVFLPIAIISSLTWATLCVIIGKIIAPYWNTTAEMGGGYRFIFPSIILIILLIICIRYFKKKRKPA
jgi:membrane protein DedA with SNARE-associated domain